MKLYILIEGGQINVYISKKWREILVELRQCLVYFVFSPQTKKLVNGLCWFFGIDGKRTECRTVRIHVRLIWQDSDISLILNSRHTISVSLISVNVLVKELHWGSSDVSSTFVPACHPSSASGIPCLDQTTLWRQPWQEPVAPETGAPHRETWRGCGLFSAFWQQASH